MRVCAKMRCGLEPIVTLTLSYSDREVVVADLTIEKDPNLLDLCRDHLERMTPPIGWRLRDLRREAAIPA